MNFGVDITKTGGRYSDSVVTCARPVKSPISFRKPGTCPMMTIPGTGQLPREPSYRPIQTQHRQGLLQPRLYPQQG